MSIHEIKPMRFPDKESFYVGKTRVDERSSRIERDTICTNNYVVRIFHTISFLFVYFVAKCNFTFNHKLYYIEFFKFVDESNMFSFKKWF